MGIKSRVSDSVWVEVPEFGMRVLSIGLGLGKVLGYKNIGVQALRAG